MYVEGDVPSYVGGGNCNNGGFFGNDGFWAGIIGLIAVAAIFGNNGGLFGGGNRGSVDAAVQRGFDTNGIMNKLEGINSGLCDGFYAMNTSLLTGFGNTQNAIMQNGYETRGAISDLGYRLQDCCCQTQRAIDGVNYNMAKNTCDIIQAGNANTQRILDYLCNEKISALQAENSLLTAQLSQNSQTQTLLNAINRTPSPAFVVPNPYTGSYGYGYNNGCCGCNG